MRYPSFYGPGRAGSLCCEELGGDGPNPFQFLRPQPPAPPPSLYMCPARWEGEGGCFVLYERLKGWFCIFFFCPVCFLFHKSEAGCILVDSLFEDRSFPGSQLPRKQILIKNQSDFYTQQKKLQLILGKKFATKESTLYSIL